MKSKIILSSFLICFGAYSAVFQFEKRAKGLDFEEQLSGHERIARDMGSELAKVLKTVGTFEVKIKHPKY